MTGFLVVIATITLLLCFNATGPCLAAEHRLYLSQATTAATPAPVREEEEEEEEETAAPEAKQEAAMVAPAPEDYSKPQYYKDAPFTVLFPGKPSRKSVAIQQFDRSLIQYTYTDPAGGAVEAAYCDVRGTWPKEDKGLTEDPPRLFDLIELCDAYKKKAVVKECTVEFCGKKIRQYELTYTTPKLPNVSLVEKKMLMIMGDRLFTFGCIGTREWIQSPVAAKVMDSFRIGNATIEGKPSEPITWPPPTTTRDAAAYMKPLLQKKREAEERAQFCSTVPTIEYVTPFPELVKIIRADVSTEQKRADLAFETLRPAADMQRFYDQNLRSNSWTMLKSPPGTLMAKITKSVGGIGFDKQLTYRLSMTFQNRGPGSAVALSWGISVNTVPLWTPPMPIPPSTNQWIFDPSQLNNPNRDQRKIR